ncbi:MAG TPA: hypothetical protein VMM60_00295 [Ilumatobacter sp.]|nr:hypothetical protein [Ilumatobacter sp.]
MIAELAGRHAPAARVAGALAVVLAYTSLAACGETYIETSVTTAAPSVIVTTTAPVDPDASVAELLTEMTDLMLGLDFEISDGRDAQGVMARIESLWDAAEPTVRATELDSAPDFDQALELARTGVDRHRPADASKAYKILADVVSAYLANNA